jgi:hypothetical protein
VRLVRRRLLRLQNDFRKTQKSDPILAAATSKRTEKRRVKLSQAAILGRRLLRRFYRGPPGREAKKDAKVVNLTKGVGNLSPLGPDFWTSVRSSKSPKVPRDFSVEFHEASRELPSETHEELLMAARLLDRFYWGPPR